VHVIPPQRALGDSRSANAILVAIFAALLFLPAQTWAHSCSTVTSLNALPTVCTLSQAASGFSAVTLIAVSSAASSQEAVLIYDNAARASLSDAAIFSRVKGVARVTFLSGPRQKLALPRDLAILGIFTEKHSPIMASVALMDGQFLDAKICSNVAGPGCRDTSDSIQLKVSKSMIPEPGTFLLVGSSMLGAGTASWLRRRIRPLPG